MTLNKITIGFLGLGLIGGSIARCVRLAYPDATIYVYSRRHNLNLEQGVKEGIINEIYYELDSWLTHCDYIFLCAPVQKNIDFLEIIKPYLSKHCIITDVGSVKGTIHSAVKELNLENQFIGGHPMAGSEKTGFENSSSTLLEHCFYLLTPTTQSTEHDVALLSQLLSCTKAKCLVVAPEEHDKATAAISHVPHLIAASLVNMIEDNDFDSHLMKQIAAGGFKDITRIASSSADVWESICISNREAIDYFLDEYINRLLKIKQELAQGNSEFIHKTFEQSKNYRDSF